MQALIELAESFALLGVSLFRLSRVSQEAHAHADARAASYERGNAVNPSRSHAMLQVHSVYGGRIQVLAEFNVHCGQALRGHELHLTGLRVDGTSDDAMHADYSEHQPGKPVHPMVSLTYTFTPGLASDDPPDGRDIDVEVSLEPPAEPAFWPSIVTGGGEREVAMGGESTHGAFGPFVLPNATRTIAFDLYQFGVTRNGGGPLDDSPERALGTLVVDLETQKATWKSPPG